MTSRTEQLIQSAMRVTGPKQNVTASSVKGLVRAACEIINKEIKASGYDYIIERTERVGGDTITKATLKRWIEGQTYTPHLSKLNAVLNACGYQLSLVKK